MISIKPISTPDDEIHIDRFGFVVLGEKGQELYRIKFDPDGYSIEILGSPHVELNGKHLDSALAVYPGVTNKLTVSRRVVRNDDA